jgi:CRISPR-associated endonuclease Cas1
MQTKLNSATGGVYVASGYGLRIHVEHGHLVVEDGIAGELRTARISRATSKLDRLVVIGHTGTISLEALRWLNDTGAAFVQIEADGNVIASSAPARHHDAKLRRAQVRAAEIRLGAEITCEPLGIKLGRQAALADDLVHLREFARVNGDGVSVAEAIRQAIDQLSPDLTYQRLRAIEAIAGRYYWQTIARLPVRFAAGWREVVPEHWHTAGPRTSPIDKKMPRRAATPVHAMLNYGYAILETEAILACHAAGLDPALGLMHTDARYRGSLATDLMEPVRPVVDRLVIELLAHKELAHGDVVETRAGVCRVGAALSKVLAGWQEELRAALVAPCTDVRRALLAKN